MSLQERVALGVALLDAEKPGWREKINAMTLDVGSNLNCVLGQVFRDTDDWSPYSTGLESLGLASGIGHGFDVRDPHYYDQLTELWRDQLDDGDEYVEVE